MKINHLWKRFALSAFVLALSALSSWAFKISCYTPSGMKSANAVFFNCIQHELMISNSELIIEILNPDNSPDITQGSEIEAMQAGKLSVGLPSPQDMLKRTQGEEQGIFKEMAVPNKIKTNQELKDYWHKNLPKIEKAFTSLRLKVIGDPLYHGVRNLHLVGHKKPLTSIQAIRNLKLRLRLPDAKNWKDVAEYFNAQPVEIKHPELAQAIDEDKFNAFEVTYTDMVAANLDKKIAQTVFTRHLVGTVFFVMSLEKFNKLTPQQQQQLEAAVAKAVEQNDTYRMEQEKRIIENLKKNGIIVSELKD